MQAIVLHQAGSTPTMQPETRVKPVWLAGHTLIRMHAASVNQLSESIRNGSMGTVHVPLVLGNEGAGVVEESDCFTRGRRVAVYGGHSLGISTDGLFQEWVLVENSKVIPLTDSLSFDEGAVLTVNYLTAWQAMHRVGNIGAGDVVLISGATGSVGHALIQVARALGALPVALVSSAEKVRRVRYAGAYAAIDWTTADVGQEVAKLTQGSGVDAAFVPVGGVMFTLLFNNVRKRGKVVSIGFTGGRETSLNLLDLIVSERKIEGYSLHSDSEEQIQEGLQALARFADQFRPVIDSSYPLEKFEDAYQRLKSRQAIGSVTLRLG